MKNKMDDLRNHLFAQLERLGDDDADIDKESQRAASLVQVAGSILESAKIENEFLKLAGAKESGFIPSVSGVPQLEDEKKN